MISIETKGGKRAYETVAERVRKFREKYPVDSGWQIVTEIRFPSDNLVLCRATIVNPEGKVVASGTAEELRGSSFINKTSAVENAETSAIGRALFAAGFGGGEFCSADELMAALKRQEELLAAEVTVTQAARESAPRTAEPAGQMAPSKPAVRQQARGRATPDAGGGTESVGHEVRLISPDAFGLPEDCGINFVQEGNVVYARDQEKGASFAHKELLKNAGFSFDGHRRMWFKEVAEMMA